MNVLKRYYQSTLTQLANQACLAKAKYYAFMALFASHAYAEYNIEAPDSGVFAKIGAFVQDLINFIDGPVAFAVSFLSIAGLAITWAFAPKQATTGMLFRVVIAVIVILNIGVWIAAFDNE